jgi:hypothetical protein
MTIPIPARPNEQRKVQQLLAKLAKVQPISTKSPSNPILRSA